MAAPTLITTGTLFGSGTSVSVASNFTSPVNGNYRLMVIRADDRNATTNQPITVTVPASWTLIYANPRGRSTKRIWVYGQVWSNATANPTVNVTFSPSTVYAITVAKFSNFTRYTAIQAVVTTPGTNFGGSVNATGQWVDAPGMHLQADAMRLDFWHGFYPAGLSSGTLHITPPATQTALALAKASGDSGYATRVSYQTTAARGFLPTHQATMTNASANGVVSLAIGGWKEVTFGSSTPMGMSRSGVGHKVTSGSSTHAMALASTSVGGRSANAATETAMALQQLHRRVFLTSTELALTSTCAGSRTGVLFTDTEMSLGAEVFGHHVAGSASSSTALDVRSTSAVRIGGGINPPSIVDHYVPAYELPTRPLRFMFQNIRTKRWLNWDVALTGAEITYTLTGPTVIRGRIGPEFAEQVEGIEAWGTWLHVEEGGVIRASGILQPLAIEGDDLLIEAVGVHGYAIGMQFENEYAAADVDPADVMRELWTYMQEFPDAKLDVTLDATATPRRLGKPARLTVKRDQNGNVLYAEIETDSAGLVYVGEKDMPPDIWAKFLLLGYPLYRNTETGERVFLVFPNDYAITTTGHPAFKQTVTGTNNETGEPGTYEAWFCPVWEYEEAEFYEIAWWNQIDIGREIENLAKQTPFDFAETPRWADATRTRVHQHITIGYPRLGTKRLDLRFAEDENLMVAVLLREAPSWYASQVIVRGAGEGRKAIRAQAGLTNPSRARRVTSITDQTITTKTRAQAVADEELRRRLAAFTIAEITVDGTHPNAPMGTFTLGDDILVQANMPYFGEVQLWHRITAYTWRPDSDEVLIQLRRSEQFAYGRVTT